MKKSKVYIHIGFHKTGSTALQSFLATNKARLSSLGYNYLNQTIIASHFTAIALGFGHGDSDPEYLERKCNSSSKRVLEELNKSIKENRVTLLSSELFNEIPSEKKYIALSNLVKGCDVKIIAYVRRQDHYIESTFNHEYRLGISDNPEGYFNNVKIDWYERLIELKKVFGLKNIVVRPYEKEQFESKSLFVDFLKVIGIRDCSKFDFPLKKINSAVGPQFIHLFHICCKNGMKYDTLEKKLLDIGIDLNANNIQLQSFFSPVQRLKIIEKYNSDNGKIARTFLNRKNGILFKEPLPNLSDKWNSIMEYEKEEIIFHLVNILLNIND